MSMASDQLEALHDAVAELNQRLIDRTAAFMADKARDLQRIRELERALEDCRFERGRLMDGMKAVQTIAKRWDTIGHQTIISVCNLILTTPK